MKQFYGKSEKGDLKEAVRGLSDPKLIILMSNRDQFEKHVEELETLYPGVPSIGCIGMSYDTTVVEAGVGITAFTEGVTAVANVLLQVSSMPVKYIKRLQQDVEQIGASARDTVCIDLCTGNDACVLTIGQFQAGSAPNIIPESAVLSGTIRTNSPDARNLLLKRMKEVSERTAEVYGGTAEVVMTGGVGPLISDAALTKEMVGYMNELPIPGLMGYPGITASASEDFAVVAEQIPSVFMYISAGFLDERGAVSAHNPKVLFNEDVLPIGSACLAHCATEWLKNNK